MIPDRDNQPLRDRTILIARDGAQTSELKSELELSGARIIICPEFEPAEPESHTSLDEAIENLYGYDWLIFTSMHGVEHFLRRLHHLDHEIDELDSLRVCMIGEATARKLEESHIHVDVIPEQLTSQAIFAALENYTGGSTNLRGLNFLIPRAAIARDSLPDLLANAGARVDVVAAYRTVRADDQQLGRLSTLLAGGGIDCVVFTSPSAVTNFAQVFDSNDLSALLGGIAVACLDETTAQGATQFGLPADLISTESTIKALILALRAQPGGLEK